MHSDTTSASYFRERERQERENAAKATDATSRAIHSDLADRYRQKAEEADRD